MEHLPHIENPAYPLPKIPCLCRVEDYDGRGLTGFPERVGWNIDRKFGPQHIDPSKSALCTPAALSQAWLYFGLLYELFRFSKLPVDISHFIATQDNNPYLNTAVLKRRLQLLDEGESDRFHEIEIDEKKELCAQRQKLMVGHLSVLDRFFSNFYAGVGKEWSISSALSPDMILSILILGETVKNAVEYIWPVPHRESPLRFVNLFQRPSPLDQRLRKLGWCQSEISCMVQGRQDNTGLFLASMLKRPFSDILSHEHCGHDSCLALQISDNDYETRHADDCPGNTCCGDISIDQRNICSILREGGIPVVIVSFGADFSGSPKVHVVDHYTSNIRYVAISHVWAHGLGNPKNNELPSCQIRRLERLSSELSICHERNCGQVGFWIDTLCIPVNPEFKEFRKLAIKRLATTYSEATQVLVLDADLQRCSKLCSRTELATRIMCSGWMKRLWTLQEAVMSSTEPNCSKLDIQFLEGPLEFNRVGGRDIGNLDHTETAMMTLFSSFPQYMTMDRAFNYLSRALEYRTTSKREDEALCIASILGLDLKSIADGNTAEQRMCMLYAQIKTMPASVLFHRSKRLRDGFHWAPLTLLGPKYNYNFSSISGIGKCDAHGLHVQFGGYVITGPYAKHLDETNGVPGLFFVGEPHEAAPRMMVRPGDYINSTVEDRTARSTLLDNLDLFELMQKTTTPAIIVNPADAAESALVAVRNEEQGVIHARFLRKIYLGKPRMESGLYDDWKDRLLQSREVSADQRWCID